MKKFIKRRGINLLSDRSEKLYDAPPPDSSVQEIPRSLKEFIQLQESVKNSDVTGDKTKSNRSMSSKSKIKKISLNNETVNSKKDSRNAFQARHDNTTARNRKNQLKQKKKLKFMKLKEKRKKKKLLAKLENDNDLKEFIKDEIKFGEVVHRPPQLSVLPRKVARSGFQNRPGRKDDLLLKSLLKRTHSK